VHIAPVPSVNGSNLVVKTLTETIETLGLGKLTVETSADKTVQICVDHIEKNAKNLADNSCSKQASEG
jgi:carbon-monoxide dehydrogenase catalytic subunit